MTDSKKITAVGNLVEALNLNKNFALIKFERTGHKNLESLRHELQKNEAKLQVFKNSLLEKAVNKIGQNDKLFRQLKKKYFPLNNNTAILILGKDWSLGLRSFHQFTQKETSLSFKLSFLDGITYDEKETQTIACLPARDELIAKLIGGLKAPLTHTTYALKFNLMKFLYILRAKSKTN